MNGINADTDDVAIINAVPRPQEKVVAYPKMNPAEDMVDLMAATRGYDANVSAMSAVKDMIQKSIDLLK